MEHRVFIAINFNQQIRQKISKYHLDIPQLPIHWTKKENLHVTLFFVGHVKDEIISEIIDIAEEVAEKHSPFFLELNKIGYGPNDKKPRMVWLTGKKSKEMGELKNDLEKRISNIPEQKISTFKEGLTPHVTLGRLIKTDFREMKEKPIIDKNVSIKFEVFSIDVIESELNSNGAQYTVLQSVNFKRP